MIRALWGEDSWRQSSAVCEKHVFLAVRADFGTEQEKPELCVGFNKGENLCWFPFSDPIIVGLRPTIIVPENKTGFFNTLEGFFSRGRLKMSPVVSMSYWSIFERNLEGMADFAGSKFQRMANWPSFDFLIETGWIAKTGRLFCIILPVSIFLSKLDQLAIRWNSSCKIGQSQKIPLENWQVIILSRWSLREQGTSREKKPAKVLQIHVSSSGTIVGLSPYGGPKLHHFDILTAELSNIRPTITSQTRRARRGMQHPGGRGDTLRHRKIP